MIEGFKRKCNYFDILSEECVEAIHQGSLEILKKTGIRFESSEALKLFKKHGCKIDEHSMRVFFPREIVEECVHVCPNSFISESRNTNRDVKVGDNNLLFISFPGMQTVDLNTWEPRKATRQDFIDFVRVLDALENHHILTAYPYFGIVDVPEVMSTLEGIAIKLLYSDKCQFVSYQKDSEIFVIQMAKAAKTDVMSICCASSPLTFYQDAVSVAFRYTKEKMPIVIVTGCVHGATGPVTIAGSLVTDNAELLAGIVLVQLLNPGNRMITNNFTFSQNMRTGSPNFGGVESFLHMSASGQLARKYGIPKWSGISGLTSSKKIDYQCGFEKSMPALIAALSGLSLVQFHGGLFGEITAHPVQAIMDDDIAGIIGRFIEGIAVNEETLALDLINEVGPIPGTYLTTSHTRKWWKKEQYIPKVVDRTGYPDEWRKNEKKGMLEYAIDRFEYILSTHKVEKPLSEDQHEDIQKILEDARAYYKTKDFL